MMNGLIFLCFIICIMTEQKRNIYSLGFNIFLFFIWFLCFFMPAFLLFFIFSSLFSACSIFSAWLHDFVGNKEDSLNIRHHYCLRRGI